MMEKKITSDEFFALVEESLNNGRVSGSGLQGAVCIRFYGAGEIPSNSHP